MKRKKMASKKLIEIKRTEYNNNNKSIQIALEKNCLKENWIQYIRKSPIVRN